ALPPGQEGDQAEREEHQGQSDDQHEPEADRRPGRFGVFGGGANPAGRLLRDALRGPRQAHGGPPVVPSLRGASHAWLASARVIGRSNTELTLARSPLTGSPAMAGLAPLAVQPTSRPSISANTPATDTTSKRSRLASSR